MIYDKIKEEFDKSNIPAKGMTDRIEAIIKQIGSSFLTMDSDSLAEAQSKLAGYRYYLDSYAGDLSRESDRLKLVLKSAKASRWGAIKKEMEADGIVIKNKEMVDNVLFCETEGTTIKQQLNENLYMVYKLKMTSIDNVLTSITMRLASLNRKQ